MLYKQTGSDRRILTFPAVHPCENISPSTLLSSLITLSCSICDYKSKYFPCNKQNARKVIRFIEFVQVFLEEIRDRQLDLSESGVLSFSELHLAFQKLQFLLQDCTREGARLWLLMESELVATHLRVLSRSIATALDVFPLISAGISGEGKEQVELLMKQARKARFEVEPDDKQAMAMVLSILNQFENKIAPHESDLKWVLDHIGVLKWSECNSEIKLLDAEIEFETLNEEKLGKTASLSSLMGFMSYCRCVMVQVTDFEQDGPKCDSRVNKNESEILSCLNSDDFRCPISLDFMTDPVTIETGHTYDRSSILKWFRSGNFICPKTNRRLCSNELVPNLVLLRLIQQYCAKNGIPIAIPNPGRRNRDIKKVDQPRSSAAKEAMKMVASFLTGKLETGSGEERNRAACEIRLLSKTSIFNRSCLVEAGTIPSLLKLLSYWDSATQENAMAAVLNLSKLPKSRTLIVQNWGLELVVDVLKDGIKIEARQHAAATVFYLASNEEYRKLIGEEPEAIPALIKLIKDGSDRGKKNGLVAMFGLLMHSENHRRVLAAGAIPLLVDLLKSCDKEDLITDSLAILANLAEKSEGTIAILHCGALNLAIEILSSSTSKAGKEHCVSLLLSLAAIGGEDVVALLVKSPSLMGSLYSLLSEGTSRASKKASVLIRILHDFYERRSPGFRASALPQEQFVRVW